MGKLIREIIFKNAINKLVKERYSQYNCYTEDMIIVFVLFNTADSFVFLNLFGIFHYAAKTTTSFKLTRMHKLITHIYFLGIIFDFSRNDFISKNFVARYSLSSLFKKGGKLDIDNKYIFFLLLKKYLIVSLLQKNTSSK